MNSFITDLSLIMLCVPKSPFFAPSPDPLVLIHTIYGIATRPSIHPSNAIYSSRHPIPSTSLYPTCDTMCLQLTTVLHNMYTTTNCSLWPTTSEYTAALSLFLVWFRIESGSSQATYLNKDEALFYRSRFHFGRKCHVGSMIRIAMQYRKTSCAFLHPSIVVVGCSTA